MSFLVVQHPIYCTERVHHISGIAFTNLRVDLGRNRHSKTWKRLADAVRSSFHLPYTSEEGLEMIHKQCMSFLIAQYPICCTERVPQMMDDFE